MTLEAVFFDLDGTLVDTAPDFVVLLNRMLREAGRPELDADRIRRQVSNGAGALVTLGFGMERGEPGFDDHLQELLTLYADHLDVETRLFPGMAEVLEQLREQRIPWGVVTNKPERFTRGILEGLGLMPSVSAIVCPDHVTLRKPDPEPMLLACHQAGVSDPEHCIYVGDHIRDVEAGRRAGMTTVACSFGYIAEDDDPREWGADYLIGHALELVPLIAQHAQTATRGVAND